MDFISVGALAWAFVMLVFNWIIGEQETSTKIIITFVYVLTWMLLFIGGFWAVSLVQVVFAIVVGIMTFGIDWMMGR